MRFLAPRIASLAIMMCSLLWAAVIAVGWYRFILPGFLMCAISPGCMNHPESRFTLMVWGAVVLLLATSVGFGFWVGVQLWRRAEHRERSEHEALRRQRLYRRWRRWRDMKDRHAPATSRSPAR